jgi:flagellar biogenesis protein FliO
MLLKLTLAVLLVCAAAFLSLKYGVRRLVGGAEDDAPMRVISRLPLEPRRSLIVTQVASKTLVLATSEAGIQLITELDAEDADALLGNTPEVPTQRPFDLTTDGDPDAEAPVQLD